MSNQWKGTGFPWKGTLASFIEQKDDYHILRTSILMILLTRRGERVMLRDFGSNIYDKPFEPNDIFLSSEVVNDIKDAIQKWDDRIGINSITVEQQDNVLKVRIIFFNKRDPMAIRNNWTMCIDVGANTVSVS